MRAMPSFTSSAVPTSRTSISARSAAWISLRRISLSSPGRRMESVAMGCRLGDCESYHKNAECETQCGIRNAECGIAVKVRSPHDLPCTFRIPHSAFRIWLIGHSAFHTRDRVLRSEEHTSELQSHSD